MSIMNSNYVYKFGIPDYNLDFVKDFTNVYQNIMWPSVEKFRLGIKLGEFITGGILHQKRLLNSKTYLIICPCLFENLNHLEDIISEETSNNLGRIK